LARSTPSDRRSGRTILHRAPCFRILDDRTEIAFAELQDDMDLARDMIKFVLQYVMEQCPQEMAFFNEMYDKELIQRINSVIESDFAKVTYTEAIEILEKVKDKFQYPVFWGRFADGT
jgi:asparaginyl-tRNA synthetase